MSKELTIQEDNYDILNDVEQTQNAVKKLLQTKHFQQLGEAGVFAIIQKAKSLKINAFDALSGSLYFLNGKTGMSAEMMNTLIRSNGHSITKDSKSNDTICILHGKRSDNGDTWTESFSIEDAKRAGIYNDKTPWGKYPRNMCFNRALSNLARQLFPDVIKGCYEIDELKSFAESPMSFNKAAYEAEIEIKESTPDLNEAYKKNFYENFNGDVEMTKKYVAMCMEKRGWTESKAIMNAQQDLVKSADAYNKWKAKQVKELAAPTETKIAVMGHPLIPGTNTEAPVGYVINVAEGE
jgi:RecT family